ncbi:uncharacterized protein M421DRAFT_342599 [Didymella exigua CBS 183.55]|uniref:Uncharacterized protein n=1 Tax=Didymella exigua CBS 183.55 TaxID=1150837 RepID=A0A6A5RW87_9PLEO|nr:uncharacterized protein M421DRAFT_342599 [Didymella exigua CBS 183.55]KAF1931258.1 hypothetical protein M421DRAFT_342599 [Didymella exigua CBS 183.55]
MVAARVHSFKPQVVYRPFTRRRSQTRGSQRSMDVEEAIHAGHDACADAVERVAIACARPDKALTSAAYVTMRCIGPPCSYSQHHISTHPNIPEPCKRQSPKTKSCTGKVRLAPTGSTLHGIWCGLYHPQTGSRWDLRLFKGSYARSCRLVTRDPKRTEVSSHARCHGSPNAGTVVTGKYARAEIRYDMSVR